MEAQKIWDIVISVTVPFCMQLEPALNGGLNNSKEVSAAISTFRSLVQATATANKAIFDKFRGEISAP